MDQLFIPKKYQVDDDQDDLSAKQCSRTNIF